MEKYIIKWTLFTFSLVFSLKGSAQDYQAVSEVYYTPIEEKIYYALSIDYGHRDSVLSHEGRVHKSIFDSAPIYKKNANYTKGDILRILVEEYAEVYNKENKYTYIKIIGQVNEATLTNIDERLKSKSNEVFGMNKLKEWPEEYYEQHKMLGKIPNEKEIDCEFYIYSRIQRFRPNIAKIKDGVSTFADTDNLIIFNLDKIDEETFVVKEMENFTSSNYDIGIKWKQKAGKKGKKLGGASVLDLTREGKVMTNTYEKKINPDGEALNITSAWNRMDAMANELVTTNNDYIESKILKAIDKAFDKLN